MKKRWCYFSLITLFFLVACDTTYFAPDQSDLIFVSLLDNEHLSFKNQQDIISRGNDADFEFTIIDNYHISSIDYEDYELTNENENTYKLSLHNVKASTRVAIEMVTESSIVYHANGGELVNSDETSYIVNFNTNLHKRINSSLGTNYVTRDGYTLIGWNTKEDYSGFHIGLGSRVTIKENDVVDLYAEWAKWSDESLFEYKRVGYKLHITNYSGNEKRVVIPSKFGKYEVFEIDENAFSNNDSVESIVLPITITTINRNAFNNCKNFMSLFYFDNIVDIDDESFVNCPNFSTLFINASHKPCFANYDRHRHYADKIDMLILSLEEEKPRMVFMSGSSMWYSLEGKQADEYFEKEYKIVNVALNSFFAAIPQFEVLTHFLKEGDIFIHAPEIGSEQELMYTNEMETRMWESFELNYDLFSYVDIRKCSKVFSSFTQFNVIRSEMEQIDYETPAFEMWIDEYGCVPFTRPQVNGDETLGDPVSFNLNLLTDEAFDRLNAYYEQIYSITKHKVMFGYGPVNEDAVPETEKNSTRYRTYEMNCEEKLKNVTFVNSVEQSLFRGHYFYYTNYHLGTEASIIWTQSLCEGIKKGLES